MCDQVQHSLFRTVVGKLQYITGVRPGVMPATNACHTNLRHQHLGTRELNLYLTIRALKPNDLTKILKHVTGYSDVDWAGDPVTRRSTSCSLCCVDQFLVTSECQGQGIVALTSGHELYALGALSADLIFAQAILKEIGLYSSYTREQSAAQHAKWQRNKERVVR